MKNTFTRKNLVAMLLVMLVAMTTIFMTGCDKEENVATVDSVATVDETETSTQATEYNTAASETTSSATASTAAAETTVGENNKANTSTNNGSDNKPADKVIVTEGNTSPQHTHSYGKVVNKATCTKDGYTVYSCACGAKYTDDYVEAYGHKWENYDKPATTESEGYIRDKCSRCDKINVIDTIDKLSSPYDASYNSNVELLRERILYYINEYRSVTANSLPRMTEYSNYRAYQLDNNFAHDSDDIKTASTVLKYGKHIVTEETIYDWETDSIISTGNMLDFYRATHCAEAIYKSTNCGGSIDEVAKKVADKIYSSSSHWSYIGASENVYVSVGIYIAEPTLYVCVTASEYYATDYE